MGIEVNLPYEKNIMNFQKFGSLFTEVYHGVKSVSPTTVVFTIFQLEKMNGLRGRALRGDQRPGQG